jgi:hypothetical protein
MRSLCLLGNIYDAPSHHLLCIGLLVLGRTTASAADNKVREVRRVGSHIYMIECAALPKSSTAADWPHIGFPACNSSPIPASAATQVYVSLQTRHPVLKVRFREKWQAAEGWKRTFIRPSPSPETDHHRRYTSPRPMTVHRCTPVTKIMALWHLWQPQHNHMTFR